MIVAALIHHCDRRIPKSGFPPGTEAEKAKTGDNARNFLIPQQHLRQELLDMLEPGSVR